MKRQTGAREGESFASVNGRITPLSKAKIAVADHGFLFGDSAYEVIEAREGGLLFLQRHFGRLRRTLDGLGIGPEPGDAELEAAVRRVLLKRPGSNSYVRLIVTRGEGAIDINPFAADRPGVVVVVKPWPVWPAASYRNGVNLSLTAIRRNDRRTLDPALKTGNYLNNVLAFREARRAGCDDAVFLNPEGALTESTTSNLFFVKKETLRTPSLECGILSGITRTLLLEHASDAGLKAETGRYGRQALLKADEAFITSCTRGVMPVTAVNGKPVGTGRVGPVTKKCMVLIKRIRDREARRVKKETPED